MTPFEIVAILLAGVAAGTINTVVGSGTLITFPTLLAFGVPPVTANVSNTVGLVPGTLSGALGYRAELEGQRNTLLGRKDAEGEFLTLTREAETTRALYDNVLTRVKSLDISGGADSSNISIAEPAMPPRRGRLRLPEALEDVGQELRRDADPGVGDRQLDVRVDPLETDLHLAASIRELDGVREEIPQHLLQPLRIARHPAGLRIENGLEPDALRVGGR